MKILIAISSKEYSGPTLDAGMNIARSLRASTTIVDVGEKISEFNVKDIGLVNDIMETWGIDRPGIDVLEWAYSYLKKNRFIKNKNTIGDLPKHLLVEKNDGRAKIFLESQSIKNLTLVLRNGEIIEELRDEVKANKYDLTIIGGSGKRNMAHDFVQYIDSSIFIVNNFNLKQNYKILLAVNDSLGTSKAVKYGVRVAQAFNNKVNLLTVSKNNDFKVGYKKASDRALKMMRRSGVEAEVHFKVGDPVDTIVKTAGRENIIVMGASRKSPLTKFFKGSKPLNVMRKCKCPVLIVK